ncbi:hypothetical protein ACMD2_08652 [Ananas comosus]|uniref:Uncharacterized protein n=1 Tax=Ananas comosus TaxID=4615 RepID=A0A199VR03_ANACO|nr:hypothetical protein ACMD2_08652 [Ananas comosus]
MRKSHVRFPEKEWLPTGASTNHHRSPYESGDYCMSSRAAAVRSPILSYGHTSKAKTCVPGVRPINLLAMGEKT